MSQNIANKYVSREEFNRLFQTLTKNMEYISLLKTTVYRLSAYTVSLEKRLALLECKDDGIHYTPSEDFDNAQEVVTKPIVKPAEPTPKQEPKPADAGPKPTDTEPKPTDAGPKPIEEEPKQVTPPSDSEDVYIDVSNSQVFQSSELYATKMCKSVIKGEKCSFGAKCAFAHGINQLRRKECSFPNCYNVRCLGNGVYTNSGNKVCDFWHKGETHSSYAKRLQIPDVVILPKVVISKPKPSILMTSENAVLDSTVYNKIRGTDDGDQALYGIHEYIKGCDCPACDGNLKDRCD